jgi:hypothetical protein
MGRPALEHGRTRGWEPNGARPGVETLSIPPDDHKPRLDEAKKATDSAAAEKTQVREVWAGGDGTGAGQLLRHEWTGPRESATKT